MYFILYDMEYIVVNSETGEIEKLGSIEEAVRHCAVTTLTKMVGDNPGPTKIELGYTAMLQLETEHAMKESD
jgi:hypothetical protein